MNVSLDYGSTLSRAWQITWRHKVLWIFGILAGCSQGGGSSSGGNGGSTDFRVNDQGGVDLPPQLEQFRNMDFQQYLPWIIGIGCAVLLLALIFYVLGLIGEGGLIHGAATVDSTGSVTFGEAWAVGVQKIVPLFLLRLLIAVPIILLVVIVTVMVAATAGLLLICLLPLLCLLIPAGIVVSIWQYFAQYYIVLEGVGVVDSLRKSWAFLRQNWSQVLVLGLITIVGAFFIGLLLALPMILAVLPTLALLIGSAAQNVQPDLGTFLPAIICGALYFPVLLILQGVLNTWLTSAWTLAFRQLTGAQPNVVAVAPAPAA